MARSYSQLQTYRRCPRQYEYGYVKKLPRGPIGPGESFGTSMHNALKKWGELEMRHAGSGRSDQGQLQLFLEEGPTEQLPDLSEETLHSLWMESFVVEGYASRVEADMARDRGREILRYYYDYWQQQSVEVMAVEKGFTLPIDEDLVLTGRFDRVEQRAEGLVIVDYKTSAVREQDSVDADLQLSVYALACEDAFGQPCVGLEFLFLREEGIIPVGTARSAGQLADACKQIAAVQGRILEGDYHPTPAKDVCRYCPYRNICDVSAV